MAKQQRVTYDTVCELAQRLPEVEESTSYGTPALKVRGKLFVRLKEDSDTIVLRTDSFEREHLLSTAPQIFFITDHYRDYPWVLVRLATVDIKQLGQLLEDAWRRVAPRKLISSLSQDTDHEESLRSGTTEGDKGTHAPSSAR